MLRSKLRDNYQHPGCLFIEIPFNNYLKSIFSTLYISNRSIQIPDKKGIKPTLHDRTPARTQAKAIWSRLSPHWRLCFLSAQCSNVCCLANNRAHSCLSGSFNTRTVNQTGKRTRGTNLACEEGPTEKRRSLSRLGSVYILFWCKIPESADRCSCSLIISHQVTLTMSSRVSVFAPPLT